MIADNEPLAILISRATRALVNRLQNKFIHAGYDITAEQWMLLRFLWRKNGQSQQQLSDAMGKNKATISPQINRLEKRKIIMRIPDKCDGRQKLIYLTKKGKALEKKLAPLNEENISQSQQNIPLKKLEICRKVLRQLCDNLNNETYEN